MASTNLLDMAVSTSGATSPASAGSITTTFARDLVIFGVADQTPNTFGAPQGTWSALTTVSSNATIQDVWYQVVASTGTFAPSATEIASTAGMPRSRVPRALTTDRRSLTWSSPSPGRRHRGHPRRGSRRRRRSRRRGRRRRATRSRRPRSEPHRWSGPSLASSASRSASAPVFQLVQPRPSSRTAPCSPRNPYHCD